MSAQTATFTTDEVRQSCELLSHEFNGWLAAHDAEVKAEALREAADKMEAIFRQNKTLGMPTDEWLRALPGERT